MSKKLTANKFDGWVVFKGLRHALRYASRVELIEFIHTFFETRNVGVATESQTGILIVHFSCKPDPRGENGVSICGQANVIGVTQLQVDIYMKTFITSEDFWRILRHELDHVIWANKKLPFCMELPYHERPHEISAFAAELI